MPAAGGSPKPRILIDALAARFGGAAYASVHLARLLAADAQVGAVTVVARRGSIVARGISPQPRLRLLLLRPRHRFELLRRLLWQAAILPRLAGAPDTAILTWSGMLPRRVAGTVVCYLANPLIFEDAGVGHTVRRWAIRRTARTAAAVVVPTQGMGELVRDALGREPVVVPLGIDHRRFRPTAQRGRELLCVGDFYPHKRHDLVLDAWAQLPEPRPVLRLIGDPRVDPRTARGVAGIAEQRRSLGTIIFENSLDVDVLLDAYQRARVLVVASERESFSMPLLEAQACGVPAVARDIASLRETGGTASRYVRGDDPSEWARAIRALLTDDVNHEAARQAGLQHAASYGWERMASALVELLSGASFPADERVAEREYATDQADAR